MTDDEFWDIERGFWLNGRAHYERYWSPKAVAGFPKPAGIMAGDSFVAALPDDGAWLDVTMQKRVLSRAAPGVVVLAYLGRGCSPSRDYACVCTSVYARDEGGWRMVQHSQTPVDDS